MSADREARRRYLHRLTDTLADELDKIDDLRVRGGNGDPSGITAASICALRQVNEIAGVSKAAFAHMHGLAIAAIEPDDPTADEWIYGEVGSADFSAESHLSGRDDDEGERKRSAMRRVLAQTMRYLPNALVPKAAPAFTRLLLALDQGDARGLFVPKKFGRGERKGKLSLREEFDALVVEAVYFYAGKSGKLIGAGAVDAGRAEMESRLVGETDEPYDGFSDWFDERRAQHNRKWPGAIDLPYRAGRVAAGIDPPDAETSSFLQSGQAFLEMSAENWREHYEAAYGRSKLGGM
jgi:hypothetical protein